MTNEQIIEELAIRLYGEELVRRLIEEGRDIPLHTAQGWNQRSGGKIRVKKGEHGLECRLWKKKKGKKDKGTEDKDKNDSTETDSNDGFYLCKSYLFRADQVEYVKEKEDDHNIQAGTGC